MTDTRPERSPRFTTVSTPKTPKAPKRIALREAGLDLLALVWPVSCVVCGAPDRQVCTDCSDALRAAEGQARWVAVSGGAAACVAGPYEGPLRALLVGYKHGGLTSLGSALGAQLRAPLCAALSLARSPEVLIVTVPSRPSRVRERGYRHVDELVRHALRSGRGIGRTGPMLHQPQPPPMRSQPQPPDMQPQSEPQPPAPANARLLRRALRVLPGRTGQVGLDSTERARNAARIAVSRSKRRPLEGREVVLVDDIITTGATVVAAARVLEAAGARVLAVAALCHTERRDRHDNGHLPAHFLRDLPQRVAVNLS